MAYPSDDYERRGIIQLSNLAKMGVRLATDKEPACGGYNRDDKYWMAALLAVALQKYDGHLSILKFTTNWRISFVTPESREDISLMSVGNTFEEAAMRALLDG